MGAHIVEGPTLLGGRQVVIETFTCSHCNTPQRKWAFDGTQVTKKVENYHCNGCMKPICAPCAGERRCLEFEQKLDIFDRMVKKTGRALDLDKLEEHALIIG